MLGVLVVGGEVGNVQLLFATGVPAPAMPIAPIERGVIMVGPDEPIDTHHLFRSGELGASSVLSLGESGRLVEAPQSSEDRPRREAKARVPGEPGSAPRSGAREAAREAAEYRRAFVAARYNVAEAARRLGLTRAQLDYRLKRHGLV
jgi:DNA-binding NtrC family response regulator